LVPKFDRVLVKRESLQQQASTIVIPEAVDKTERPARGVIIALGPTVGYLDDETREIVRDLEVGMRVIFGKHAGTELEVDGDKFWVVADKDILCSIEDD
jgi:chaperonin GroES